MNNNFIIYYNFYFYTLLYIMFLWIQINLYIIIIKNKHQNT